MPKIFIWNSIYMRSLPPPFDSTQGQCGGKRHAAFYSPHPHSLKREGIESLRTRLRHQLTIPRTHFELLRVGVPLQVFGYGHQFEIRHACFNGAEGE